MDYTFTVIIPHHNIPALLDRCLKSIPDRDDLQIIVVDDASKEDFKEAIYNVEKKYPRASFLYQKEGGGGGKARNVGLSYATGKYLIFADADDFFEEEFNSILDDYKDKEFDLAFFKGTSRDTDTYRITHRTDHLNRYIDLYNKGQDSNAYNLRYLFGEPWCKIVKRDVVVTNKIRYDETNIHNDTTFGYLVGYYAAHVIVDNRPLYCVTTRSGSVSLTTSDDRILTRVQVYGRAELFFREKNLPIEMKEHYVQMVRLLAHGKFRLLHRCVVCLNNLGYSSCYIYMKLIRSFIDVMLKRLDNNG